MKSPEWREVGRPAVVIGVRLGDGADEIADQHFGVVLCELQAGLPGDVAAAEVRDEQSIVRDRDGREVVSSSKVTLPLPVDVPLESLVTVWPGTSREREAMVLAVESNPNEDALDAYLVLSLE